MQIGTRYIAQANKRELYQMLKKKKTPLTTLTE